ncbi:MAG TPA: GNAT family N-acetyltransferase [Gemmatimonadaceae bacterium]|nr:GNAT family N-acetyltransferase [Gemmatimonadaceae bacterium]
MIDLRIAPIATDADVEAARGLVRAHGEARMTTPGVEYVFRDADRLPGPYVPPDGTFLIAWAGNVAAGCGALKRLDATRGEVKRMFVRPEYRGAGVARRIMEQLIATARHVGYERLCLGTLDDMIAAQRLYESLGFTPVPRYRSDELIDTRFYELDLHARSAP